MDYLTLCQRVREEAGVSGSGPSTVTGQTGQLLKIVNWVKSAWNDIQMQHNDWKFHWKTLTFDTTIAEDAYTIGATDIREVQRVSVYGKIAGISDETMLTEVSYDELRLNHKVGTEDAGRPQYFAIRNDGAIVFAPTPEKVYVAKVEYYRTPQVLAANTDVPIMPVHYHEAIVWKALMKFSAHYESNMQYQDSMIQFNDYMSKLEMYELPPVRITGPLV